MSLSSKYIDIYPWTLKPWKMKVLIPKYMGEITPKNEGNVGFHHFHPVGSKLWLHASWLRARLWPRCGGPEPPKMEGSSSPWYKLYRYGSFPSPKIAGYKVQGILHFRYLKLLVRLLHNPLDPLHVEAVYFWCGIFFWGFWADSNANG